jgi:hypothetical protein|tara:strand:+ start:324 stop:515 length:192 start_codon:yes stop_codon:yes gene_type:complete
MENNIVYSGTYTHEGHDVNFEVNTNGVTIIETKDGKIQTPMEFSLKKATFFQNQLIKWGYISY